MKRWTIADESLPMNRRQWIVANDPSLNCHWWTVVNKPLIVADKPTLRLQIVGDASPCSHQRHFSFISDALKCYFSSRHCRFSTHSSPILDDSHSSPILDPFVANSRRFWSVISAHSSPIRTLRDEVFTVDLDHSRRFGIGKVLFYFIFLSFPSAHFCWEWVFISFLVLP